MTLFEINKELMDAYDKAVDPETGEINESWMTSIEQLEGMKKDKIKNVALWIKNLSAEAEALKAEKMAFAERQKQCENKIANLKQYIMFATEGQKFETTEVKISFRNTPVVEIAEGTILPEQYLRFKDPEPDKTALKEALKAGEVIDGCALVNSVSVQIK